MILEKTSMETLPNNCFKCSCAGITCNLPMRHNSKGIYTNSIKNKYLTQRHKNCPLIDAEIENQNYEYDGDIYTDAGDILWKLIEQGKVFYEDCEDKIKIYL